MYIAHNGATQTRNLVDGEMMGMAAVIHNEAGEGSTKSPNNSMIV